MHQPSRVLLMLLASTETTTFAFACLTRSLTHSLNHSCLLPHPHKLLQGEKEAAAGIPISPPCNVSTVCMPAAQLFFIERFMAPTLEAFSSAAPSFHTLAAAWLADTQVRGCCALPGGPTASLPPSLEAPHPPQPASERQSAASSSVCLPWL